MQCAELEPNDTDKLDRVDLSRVELGQLVTNPIRFTSVDVNWQVHTHNGASYQMCMMFVLRTIAPAAQAAPAAQLAAPAAPQFSLGGACGAAIPVNFLRASVRPPPKIPFSLGEGVYYGIAHLQNFGVISFS